MKSASGRLIAVTLLAVLGAYLSACGGSASDTGGEGSGSESPLMQLLGEASLSAVRSSYFEALFFLDNETREEAVQWRAIGPYQRAHEGALRANARYEHAGIYDGTTSATRGSLLILGGRTLFRHNGKDYRLPPGEASELAATCQRALEAVDFDALVKNLSSKPEPVMEATVIEGVLDLHAMFGVLHRLMAPSACGKVVQGAGVSPVALKALEAVVKKTFKKSVATFTIDKDHVLTGISLGIWVESSPPKPEEIDGTLTVNLSRINEIAAIHESPAAKSAYAGSRQPPAQQLSRVEAWTGVVGAVLRVLGSP